MVKFHNLLFLFYTFYPAVRFSEIMIFFSEAYRFLAKKHQLNDD